MRAGVTSRAHPEPGVIDGNPHQDDHERESGRDRMLEQRVEQDQERSAYEQERHRGIAEHAHRPRSVGPAARRKNRPSSAIAKKMRGAVSIDPSSVLKVETMTTTAMMPTPTRPTSSCAASAATSGDCATCASGSRYRYAALTRR